MKDPNIADLKERQYFWTETMRDESVQIQYRIKCSELLSRVQRDVEVSSAPDSDLSEMSDSELMRLLSDG